MRLSLLAILIAGSLPWAQISAQSLFRYQDENGNWVYSDRAPPTADVTAEQVVLNSAFVPPDVSLVQRRFNGGVAIVVHSTYYSHVQIAWWIDDGENVATSTGSPLRGNVILEPRSDQEIVRFVPQQPDRTMRFEMSHQFIPGRPGAQHRPQNNYRVPFAAAASFPVSQAYPATATHGDPSNRHAIDFVMPIGTGVYAARAGVVIEIADKYFTAGLDPNTDLARANIVRIVHDDGTMSLYAHLNWNSIRVRPGQRVNRGEYIADSGNTGFSTGPHLHFVVQRNVGGAIESVPVQFDGAGNSTVTYSSGDIATAY